MKILFLEPFFGGSHKDFALGFKETCTHDVDLLTLPDRFWKWRMRGAALYFSQQIENIHAYDLIMATDMLDVTDFIALIGKDCPPVFLYFHENQLVYPLSPGQTRDFHLGFTNILSALAAEQVFFNSQVHLDTFLSAARDLIRKMPDFQPKRIIEKIQQKTRVIYPGCRFDTGNIPIKESVPKVPLILWNHRWEHDKNPEAFFNALAFLKEKKIAFRLAVLGGNFSKAPVVFEQAKDRFKEELEVFGYVESRQTYLSWLQKADIVVSTAFQENFGISVVEAVRYGCMPLLPDRLSYPEIMPDDLHARVLYRDDQDLACKLEDLLKNHEPYLPVRKRLSREMERFSWKNIIRLYPLD